MRKSLEARIREGISRGWRMMNPYNEAEIRDVAPTVTCGSGGAGLLRDGADNGL